MKHAHTIRLTAIIITVCTVCTVCTVAWPGLVGAAGAKAPNLQFAPDIKWQRITKDTHHTAKKLPTVTHLTPLMYTADDFAWARAAIKAHGIHKNMTAKQIADALRVHHPDPRSFENAVAWLGRAFFITDRHSGFSGRGWLAVKDVPFQDLSKAYSNCTTTAFWAARIFQAAGYDANVVVDPAHHAWCQIYSGVVDVIGTYLLPPDGYRTWAGVQNGPRTIITFPAGGTSYSRVYDTTANQVAAPARPRALSRPTAAAPTVQAARPAVSTARSPREVEAPYVEPTTDTARTAVTPRGAWLDRFAPTQDAPATLDTVDAVPAVQTPPAAPWPDTIDDNYTTRVMAEWDSLFTTKP